MGLKELIEEPVGATSQDVIYEGNTFRVTGMADANVIGRTLMMTPDQRKTRANHWSTVLGVTFDEQTVPRAMLVQSVLEHEDDPARRYDEVEIAHLAVKQGPLFVMLFMAALQVVGYTAEGPMPAIMGAAAGNSESSEESGQTSPSSPADASENPLPSSSEKDGPPKKS